MSDQQIRSKYVVLAAVDMRDGSPLVLSRALAIAGSEPGGEVHVIAVNEPAPAVVVPPMVPTAEQLAAPDPGRLADFARSILDDHKRRVPGGRIPPVEVHTALGFAPDEIVWLAAHVDADLIVVSTHGRRGLKRLLLGSVAEKVVRVAGCPVLVVRDKHHTADWKTPEIEPLCTDCAAKRKETNGAQLWCERHSVHHVRAHVYSTADRSPGLSATESATGT
jgi:nucleotide-binding universal stress UspA family protein